MGGLADGGVCFAGQTQPEIDAEGAVAGAPLQGGAPPETKNMRRWTPLDEAVALRDREAAVLLLGRLKADAKAELKAKKASLVATLAALPDFRLKARRAKRRWGWCIRSPSSPARRTPRPPHPPRAQLRWELGSPLFGLLLKSFAPDDCYHLTKRGTQLRVDGTLMGLDHESHSLLPRVCVVGRGRGAGGGCRCGCCLARRSRSRPLQWRRGSFSILVNTGQTPVTMRFVDWERQVWVDLYKARKKRQQKVEVDVETLFQEGASKVRMSSTDFAFQAVRTWLGRNATERVDGWQTQARGEGGVPVRACGRPASPPREVSTPCAPPPPPGVRGHRHADRHHPAQRLCPYRRGRQLRGLPAHAAARR